MPQITTLSTSLPYCATFSNGQEYFSTTDQWGVVQDATLSNGSHACIRVDYYPVQFNNGLGAPACYYFFYVPDQGYANANVVFGWWDSSGKHYAATVNEANVGGWYELYMGGTGVFDPAQAVGVTRISFQDNNGQAPGSTYLGWGSTSDFGIYEFC